MWRFLPKSHCLYHSYCSKDSSLVHVETLNILSTGLASVSGRFPLGLVYLTSWCKYTQRENRCKNTKCNSQVKLSPLKCWVMKSVAQISLSWVALLWVQIIWATFVQSAMNLSFHCYAPLNSRLKVKWTAPHAHSSELRDITCHRGSHSVTYHPTQVNAACLTPAKIVCTRLTYSGGIEGWVDLGGWLYQDGLPGHRRSVDGRFVRGLSPLSTGWRLAQDLWKEDSQIFHESEGSFCPWLCGCHWQWQRC